VIGQFLQGIVFEELLETVPFRLRLSYEHQDSVLHLGDGADLESPVAFLGCRPEESERDTALDCRIAACLGPTQDAGQLVVILIGDR
jgi:hypothetical protein